MNRESSNEAPRTSKPPHAQEGEEWREDDLLWQLLDEASDQRASAFFTRDVLRETRKMSSEPSAVSPQSGFSAGLSRLAAFFTPPRLALATCACVCAVSAYVMWQASDQPSESAHQMVESSAADVQQGESPELPELVIAEALSAAAEDPSMFTRDEVVVMLGL